MGYEAEPRKDPRGSELPFLAVRRKPSGAAKPEGLRPTASFNPVIYFRASPKWFPNENPNGAFCACRRNLRTQKDPPDRST